MPPRPTRPRTALAVASAMDSASALVGAHTCSATMGLSMTPDERFPPVRSNVPKRAGRSSGTSPNHGKPVACGSSSASLASIAAIPTPFPRRAT